jgi:hypothetical protein
VAAPQQCVLAPLLIVLEDIVLAGALSQEARGQSHIPSIELVVLEISHIVGEGFVKMAGVENGVVLGNIAKSHGLTECGIALFQ